MRHDKALIHEQYVAVVRELQLLTDSERDSLMVRLIGFYPEWFARERVIQAIVDGGPVTGNSAPRS